MGSGGGRLSRCGEGWCGGGVVWGGVGGGGEGGGGGGGAFSRNGEKTTFPKKKKGLKTCSPVLMRCAKQLLNANRPHAPQANGNRLQN